LRIPAAMGLALAFLLACPGSRAQAQGSQGAELAGRLGCLACHALNRPGGKLAARLDGVGARLTAGELAIAIAYPRQRHPRAKMPSYAYLPPMEQAALVEFLLTLK
jgi:mono/diheme cytochrome c family protein